MPIQNPYYRIIRPNHRDHQNFNKWYKGVNNNFILDERYSNERISLVKAFKLIENDLLQIFNYVEPSDQNERAYSHRIYELFLRSCIEVEANCKAILNANRYSKLDRNGKITDRWDMNDYKKINRASKIGRYEVFIESWRPNKFKILPFNNWQNNESLEWYQSYNEVKHNREENFEKANFKNLIVSVAGLFAVLFSQFYTFVYNPTCNIGFLMDDSGTYLSSETSIFSIKLPDFNEDEMYDFNWTELKNDPEPFQKFDFNSI